MLERDQHMHFLRDHRSDDDDEDDDDTRILMRRLKEGTLLRCMCHPFLRTIYTSSTSRFVACMHVVKLLHAQHASPRMIDSEVCVLHYIDENAQ